jgi:hypothetical protein
MTIKMNEKIIALFADQNALKILGTAGKDGIPHTAVKQSLHLDAEGNIRYFELIESSQSNRNMTYSLWFERPVSIHLAGAGKSSVEIIGTPVRALITGEDFERAYVKTREILGEDTDLSTVWVIRPDSMREMTYEVRLKEHIESHPFTIHLDRVRKTRKES